MKAFGVLFVGLLASPAALHAAEIHVGIHGSDDGAGTKERPFSTITRAREAVRELKRQRLADGPIEVVIPGGTYYLPETVLLSPADSGTEQAPIIYRAADGERVVLSGWRRIGGPWKKEDGAIWSADLLGSDRDWEVRQLFVNGRREIRARFPNVDATPPHLFGGGGKKDSITVAAGTIKAFWGAALDTQVHVVPEWRFFNQIQTVAGVDPAQSLIRLGPEEQHARITDGSWFHIEGVREELDQAREWFFDASTRRVFYWPEEGREPDELEIVAPRLNRVFHFKGDVEHIRQNVVGAVSPQTGELFSLIVDGVDTDVFRFFLDQLAQTVPPQTGIRQLLVMDNASWHKAARLNWHHFEPVYLPGYSPD
jgi:hypothetical protein